MSQYSSLFSESYDECLRSLKERIRQAQMRAEIAVNSELQASLPTIEQLELEVAAVVAEVEGAAVEES
jgi:hypothetical protein